MMKTKRSAIRDEVKELPIQITDRVYDLKESFFARDSFWVTERGRLITEAYREHEADHLYVKRAKAFAHILDNRTLYINGGELVVGNYACEHSAYELYPEYSLQDFPARYVHFEMETMLTEEAFDSEPDRAAFRDIQQFWKGRNMRDISDAAMPPDVLKIRDFDICGNAYGRDEGQGHLVIQYDRVVREGLRSVINEAEERLAEVGHADPKAYHFLRSVIISLEAIVRLAGRYAQLARDLAAVSQDPVRRGELEQIAANFDTVPEKPAETFWQGLQTTWLMHMLLHIEQNGFSISVGRMDQYLNELYENDLKNGTLDIPFAYELLQNFYVKCMELTIGGQKISLTQTVTLGGKDREGNDCSNDLSLLCIKADRATQMVQPQTTLRWHKGIDPCLVDDILEGTWKGEATFAIVNDEELVPALEAWDIQPEDALDYALIGCNETEIPGKLLGGGLCRPMVVSRLFDLALHGGKYRYPNVHCEQIPEANAAWKASGEEPEQLGPRTKKLGEYESIEEVVESFRLQYRYFLKYLVTAANIMDDLHAEYRPLPFASSLMSGCIQRGRDLMAETDYFHYAVGALDIVPVVNSLAALEQCVFTEKTVTQEELLAAINCNWEGCEELHKTIMDAPKFGNDIDSCDQWITRITSLCLEELSRYRSFRNDGKIWMECIARAGHVYIGSHTKALPDGRMDWEAMPPSLSATGGTDRDGPTALLNSCSKARADHFVGGTITNLRLHPAMLNTESARTKTRHLISAYFKEGGEHVQMNCLSMDDLRDAQKRPEKYRDLLVRVSGYVDYWTNLDQKTQDEIICRTEMGG